MEENPKVCDSCKAIEPKKEYTGLNIAMGLFDDEAFNWMNIGGASMCLCPLCFKAMFRMLPQMIRAFIDSENK